MKDNVLAWALISAWALVPIASIAAGVIVQRLKTKERLLAIEKGIPLPPRSSRPPLTPWAFAANFRLAGIICIAVGLGLLTLFTALALSLPEFPKGVIAVSAIPFFIGLGLLAEYRIRRKELQAREHSDGSAGGR